MLRPGSTTDPGRPNQIHVAEGEPFGDPPVSLDRGDQLLALRTAFPELHDPLLTSFLERISADTVLEHLQPHDPVSWHCTRRQAQHRWLVAQQDLPGPR